MRKSILIIVALVIFTSVAVVGVGSAASPTNNKPEVLHQWTKRPNPERVIKKFEPPGDASGEYIINVIIPYEAGRYHTSPITGRVECESGFRDNVTNGQYGGLIQTDEDYWYDAGAWPSVVADGDLSIKMKSKKKVKRKVFRVKLWDTNKKTYKQIGTQFVRRVVVKQGKLPENADWFHAWAAIRVGTRAVAGVGPTTYWACTHNGSHY